MTARRDDFWHRFVGLRVVSRLAAELTALTDIPIYLADPGRGVRYPLAPQRSPARECACPQERSLVHRNAGLDRRTSQKKPLLVPCSSPGASHYLLPLKLGGHWGRLVTSAFVRDGTPQISAPGPVLDPTMEPLYAHLFALIGDEMERFAAQEGQPRATGADDGSFIGEAPSIRQLREEIRAIGATTYAALIEGETGTGKNLVARLLHAQSRRARGPFVVVNCPALPESLFENEVFGHGVGAYTGAYTAKRGLIEAANGGTLLLDELGELSLAMQAKLLGVVETGTFHRLGEARPVEVNVRILAATNRDLGRMVQEGKFRADLYYRLRVATLRLPPLRERKEDVPLLARHFLSQIERRTGQPVPQLSPEAEQALTSYDWPGNVRQLLHELERACILARGPWLVPENFSAEIARGWNAASGRGGRCVLAREEVERLLADAGWNVSAVARRLGLSRRALTYKLARFGVRRPSRQGPT